MSLEVLDLRENQLTAIKSNSKFLSDTVVLAWGNPMTERGIDSAIQKTKVGKAGFNPLLLLKGNAEQQALVETV